MLQLVRNMEEVEGACWVGGYHTYKEVWAAAVGEYLKCQRELSNLKDRYTVVVLSNGTIVRHLTRRIPMCTLHLHVKKKPTFYLKVKCM